MLLHDLLLYFRSFKINLSINLINLFGLALGMAAVISIGLFVHHERSYDAFHEDSERIYRLVTHAEFAADQTFDVPGGSVPMAVDLEREIDAIEEYCRLDLNRSKISVQVEDKTYLESNIVAADSNFFEFFTYPLVRGKASSVLTKPNTVVLTTESASRYFGDQDPIGKQLVINNRVDSPFTVSGIMELPDHPSHIPDFEMVCSWSSWHSTKRDNDSWLNNVDFPTYLKLKKGVDPATLYDPMQASFEKHAGDLMKSLGMTSSLTLEPITECYLNGSQYQFNRTKAGSRVQVTQFLVIGIFTLLMASLNYINLATARSLTRMKQLGIDKVLGAQRLQLIRRQLIEAIFTSLIAMIVALGIIKLATPFITTAFGIEIQLPMLSSVGFGAIVLSGAIFIGCLAGIYPALAITNFKPVEVIRGQLHTGKKGTRIRSALVFVQFAITIGLISSTLLVMRQLDYMKKKELGYDTEQIVALMMLSSDLRKNHESMRHELEAIPGITATATAQVLPFATNSDNVYHIPGTPDESSIIVAKQRIGYDYFNLMNLKLIEGEYFSRDKGTHNENAIIINRTLANLLTVDPIVGSYLDNRQTGDPNSYIEYPIIGIVEDFHFSSLHSEIRPLVLTLYTGTPAYIYAKITPSAFPETMQAIEKLWAQSAPGVALDYTFLDDQFNSVYKSELRLEKLINMFTVLSIIIASLGLFAISTFSAEQRTREIAVRKVLGATISSIIHLLSSNFMILVIGANLVAWPAVWLAMDHWLKNYAYRPAYGWWLYLAGSGITLLIALAMSILQAVKAARTNPALVLRSQ